jgi:hypothetical protein
MGVVLATITFIHVMLSLVGIGSGFVVMYGLISTKRFETWTGVFLSTTVATSITGFLFPFERFLPSHAIGIISLLVLALAIFARYACRLAGFWCWIFVLAAVTAQYLNSFVLIVQLFRKAPALTALAPTQNEPVFVVVQLVVLGLFVLSAVTAVIRFRSQAVRAA